MNNLKPFLRWAGGKTWLIKQLSNYLPINGYNDYHEPFLGGGSVFFSLQPQKAFLSDLNKDLIDTYRQVKNNVEEVIIYLSEFSNTAIDYYETRSALYLNEAQNAAKFIYLNQTSFNGIYRVNLKGEYNVPFGYRSKNFFDPISLRAASKALVNVELTHSDFDSTLANIKENDLVFIDPPYTVAHENNGFVKYNQKIFAWEDQERLSIYLKTIKKIGAHYIMTNAAHKSIEELYLDIGEATKLQRASLIGGRGATRAKYNELIYSNAINKNIFK
jgi:DNA adenine methylase